MAWFVLFIAGLFEIGWAVGLKHTHGFSRLWPTLGTLACMVISLGLLGWSMKSLPVGTAYSTWVGIGTVGTVAVGVVCLGEPMGLARLLSVGLVIAGVVGIKLTATG